MSSKAITYHLQRVWGNHLNIVGGVYHVVDSGGNRICRIDATKGGVLQKLLKRGISLDDAQRLADQMQ